MPRTYKIQSRPEALDGGWRLIFFLDGQEVGGGIFPLPQDDPKSGMAWWNDLTEERRAHWLMMSASAMPAAARHAYLLAEAYNVAIDRGELWANS